MVFHLVAVTLMALPAPGGAMNRVAWEDPTVQGEFAVWTSRINALGIAVSQEEFEDQLFEFAEQFMSLRETVLDPFRPYHLYFGTWQSWRMFVAPHRYPGRIHIDLQGSDDVWQPLYQSRSSEHDWNRALMDHDRMRSLTFRYSWKPYRFTWKAFGVWVAKQAAVDFPEAKRVRLQVLKYRTLTPEETRAGAEIDGKLEQALTYTLDKYR